VDVQEPGADTRATLNLQASLFDDLPAEERPGARIEDVGYRGPTACSAAGITYLRVVKKLLDAGVSLPNIRTAIGTLRNHGVEDLGQVTLISDGTTVYECTSTDEMVDLLQGGQAVFAIAVGRQVREVEGTLAQLPGERAHRDEPSADDHAADELANRRKRRTSA
jgi:DNA-binding transcriptional MerR regulator